MYLSGIREAYDYPTMEGWWVIYSTYPEENFRKWMEDFPYDCWCSTVELGKDGLAEDKRRDWDYIILIKNPAAYLHFRSTWQTDYEYMVCHEPHNINSVQYHFAEHMPNGWMYDDNLPIHSFQA